MKNIIRLKWALILLCQLGFLSNLSANDSARAAAIIRRFSEKLKSFPRFSFECRHRYVDHSADDSVFSSTSTIWIERSTADSIFGIRFHVAGNDKSGDFDYYYDGLSAIEIRHRQKEILTINPYDFPNDESNPARSRTSLRIFRSLWTEPDLFSFLVTHYPYANPPQLSLDSLEGQWVIRLNYPINAYKAKTDITVWVDQKTGLLTKSERQTEWNGTLHSETNEIYRVMLEDQFNSDNLYLKNSYAGYKTTVQKPHGPSEKKDHPLTGKKAPDFTYVSYDGKNINLASLKGKYVLLDFWESWCGYCILALPKIKKVYADFHSKGLEVVGVTTENFSKMEKLIAANELPYPNLKADDRILKKYDINARPNYVLIDKEGKILIYNDWERIEAFLAGLK